MLSHSVLFCVAAFRIIVLDILPNETYIRIGRLEAYVAATQTWEYVWLLSMLVAGISAWATSYNRKTILWLTILGEEISQNYMYVPSTILLY